MAIVEEETLLPHGGRFGKQKLHKCLVRRSAQLGIAVLILVAALAFGALVGSRISSMWGNSFSMPTLSGAAATSKPMMKCRNPRIRREWRSLSRLEQHNYFDAVYCLLQQPPVLANRSFYDDFPYAHATFDEATHDTALFLPWHRYFLHIWEENLVQQCGYGGALPYWDWSLDWNDFQNSPVFDGEYGFGGDGNITGEMTAGEGRCLVDGIFVGLYALRYDSFYAPHCLSRGMLQGEALEEVCGMNLHPNTIARVLEQPTFEGFTRELEGTIHLCIPSAIGGDWHTPTAPNDPLWFSHHAQVDHLWWLWQQKSLSNAKEYSWGTLDSKGSTASPSDELSYGGFVAPVQVAQVLGTESETLCYSYE